MTLALTKFVHQITDWLAWVFSTKNLFEGLRNNIQYSSTLVHNDIHQCIVVSQSVCNVCSYGNILCDAFWRFSTYYNIIENMKPNKMEILWWLTLCYAFLGLLASIFKLWRKTANDSLKFLYRNWSKFFYKNIIAILSSQIIAVWDT